MDILRDRVKVMKFGGKVPLHSSHIEIEGHHMVTNDMESALHPRRTGHGRCSETIDNGTAHRGHRRQVMMKEEGAVWWELHDDNRSPATQWGHRNLCYEDGLEGKCGHYRCPRMGSICDGDDGPQRSSSGIHWTTLTVQ